MNLSSFISEFGVYPIDDVSLAMRDIAIRQKYLTDDVVLTHLTVPDFGRIRFRTGVDQVTLDRSIVALERSVVLLRRVTERPERMWQLDVAA